MYANHRHTLGGSSITGTLYSSPFSNIPESALPVDCLPNALRPDVPLSGEGPAVLLIGPRCPLGRDGETLEEGCLLLSLTVGAEGSWYGFSVRIPGINGCEACESNSCDESNGTLLLEIILEYKIIL